MPDVKAKNDSKFPKKTSRKKTTNYLVI